MQRVPMQTPRERSDGLPIRLTIFA